MGQLIMNWKNDGKEREDIVLPERVGLTTFDKLPNAVYEWLGIVAYMSQYEPDDVFENTRYYKEVMTDRPFYSEDKCFFITYDGVPAATAAVLCDYEKKDAYVHMVACKKEFRGKGLGMLLARVILDALKKEGMESATLTTDDWRIPAIKTYLRIGFIPDLESEEDFAERWDRIKKIIATGEKV